MLFILLMAQFTKRKEIQMQGDKEFKYITQFSSEDVNKLVAELVELFVLAPALTQQLPTVFTFLGILNQLLGRQDFNKDTVQKYRETMRTNGLPAVLKVELPKPVVPAVDTAPVTPVAPEVKPEETKPTKKTKKPQLVTEAAAEANKGTN
jgi:hypothetical protein